MRTSIRYTSGYALRSYKVIYIRYTSGYASIRYTWACTCTSDYVIGAVVTLLAP